MSAIKVAAGSGDVYGWGRESAARYSRKVCRLSHNSTPAWRKASSFPMAGPKYGEDVIAA
jgi:hypothetical protein